MTPIFLSFLGAFESFERKILSMAAQHVAVFGGSIHYFGFPFCIFISSRGPLPKKVGGT